MDQTKPIQAHTDQSINYKFLLVMILAIITFHYLVNFIPNDDETDIILSVFSIINPIITGLAALIVSSRYAQTNIGLRSKSFRYSYIALGVAYLAAAGGEVLFFIYDYFLGKPAFPSPADFLFIPFYPLVFVYLYLNTSFFKPVFSAKYFGVIMLPTLIIISYVIMLDSIKINQEFLISLYYIIVSSISLAFTVYAAIIFKDSLVGKTWLLLLLGMMTFTVADIVYYNLEATNSYDLAHPVNLLWYVGYWIITYALYKHPSRKNEKYQQKDHI